MRINVLNSEGEQIATGQTDLTTTTLEIKVKAAGHAGETWSLEITKADQGCLEDYTLRLDSKLAPTLSLAPQHVFELQE